MNLHVQITWQAQHVANLHAQISWQAQHFVNLHVQILWQAQHFVNLHAQISRQAQHFVNLHVQSSWQAQHFVNLHVQIAWQAQYFVNLDVTGSRCLPARRPVGSVRTASGRDREKRRFLLPSEDNVWHRQSTSEDEIEKIFTAVRKQRLAPREHL